MIRKIIKIDEDKCNGCGLCADACHENAIAIVNGKARLIRDDYCDGLGNCLPACPTEAISFEEREAAPYDDAAVKARQEELRREAGHREDKKGGVAELFKMPIGGCPGSRMRDILRDRGNREENKPKEEKREDGPAASADSELAQNTYNAPDEINQFDWNRVADHQETVDYVRGLIKLRKSLPLFRQNSYDEKIGRAHV